MSDHKNDVYSVSEICKYLQQFIAEAKKQVLALSKEIDENIPKLKKIELEIREAKSRIPPNIDRLNMLYEWREIFMASINGCKIKLYLLKQDISNATKIINNKDVKKGKKFMIDKISDKIRDDIIKSKSKPIASIVSSVIGGGIGAYIGPKLFKPRDNG